MGEYESLCIRLKKIMNKILVISTIIFYSGLAALGYGGGSMVTVSDMTDVEISVGSSIAIDQWSDSPTGKEQCKNGGWKDFIDPRTGEPFKNQGQCIRYFICLEHGKCCGDINIEINNENTSVVNNVRTEADTGENLSDGDDIETGDASATTTVTNIINQSDVDVNGNSASTTPSENNEVLGEDIEIENTEEELQEKVLIEETSEEENPSEEEEKTELLPPEEDLIVE